MASGTINQETKYGQNITLLDAVSATSDGVWVSTANFPEGSIDVTIETTATVQVRGSDAPAKPADATHGNQVGTDITASGQFVIVSCPRWLKARVSAHTAGAVTVNATFRQGNIR